MRILRRVLLLMTMIMLTSSVANAEFRFGIKAGLNVNKLHFNQNVWDASNRTGFTAGVMTEFTVPLIGIGMDLSLMYTRMNSEVTSEPADMVTQAASTPGTPVDGSVGKNFLQIPLNLKYKLTIPAVSAIIKPYVFTGPSFNFKLDKNTWDDLRSKTCQVAWNLGLGVELIKHLQISGSYAWGINNIAKNVGINSTDIDLKNNYWTITAAWLF